MTATITARAPLSWKPIAAWTCRVLLVVWAGFWSYFVIAVGIHDMNEGLAGTLPHVLGFLAAFAGLTAVAWRWPRAGGVVLMLAAAGGAWYFSNPGAFWLLSAPAFALGALIALIGGPRAGR